MDSFERNARLDPTDSASEAVGLALLPLTLAIAIMLVFTIYPLILSKADGKADHLAATLLLWAMSAGFVRGVGFVPKHRALKLLFSTSACLLTFVLAGAVVTRRWLLQ